MNPGSAASRKLEHPNSTNHASNMWVLVAIGASTLMSALDGSVVNIVLPIINRTLGSEIAAVEWVVVIYLLVLSGLLLSFGRLGDLKGHKPVFITGLVVFIAGSVFCGLSQTILTLVLFRAIQAIGAAMVQSNSPAIITKTFPGTQRGQALGIVATMTYIGLTIGPSLGGFLTDQFSWRSVFFINIPIGILVLYLSSRFILELPTSQPTEKFDIPGAITFTGGLVLLLFALNQGHSLGWGSPAIIGLFFSSILLFGIFIVIERRSPSPMVDLSLFTNRLFSASVSSAILNYICVYSIIFLLPFYLIQARSFSTAQAGMLLTTQPIIMAIIAPISGTLSDRKGTKVFTFLGMLLLALGLFLLSRLDHQSSLTEIVISLGVVGLGTGAFISPNNSALMGSAPKNRQGTAAGIMATARNSGMALGVGFAGAIFTTTLGSHGINENVALYATIHISFLLTAVIALIGALITAIPSRVPVNS
jgi:EmrB/QacA subfamily drug resistance transporter